MGSFSETSLDWEEETEGSIGGMTKVKMILRKLMRKE